MTKGVLLIGEPLGLLIARTKGRLENVTGYDLAVAGAEFNVAVGLKRLGHNVTYMSKLGKDPFGNLIVNVMNDNGIDTSSIQYSNDHTTGFMLKSKVEKGDPEIFYYRKNSAASTLSKEDIDQINFSDYGIVHVTGILPALTDTTREAVFYLLKCAKEKHLTITFDPNLRPQLWEDEETMVSTINKIAASADVVMPGESEGKILCGTDDPQGISDFYHKAGVKTVITKVGSRGAYISAPEVQTLIPGYRVEKVVDTVGAGDGFAAGILSGMLEGLSIANSVDRGNAIGAVQVMSHGDNDGLPSREELAKFMGKDEL